MWLENSPPEPKIYLHVLNLTPYQLDQNCCYMGLAISTTEEAFA